MDFPRKIIKRLPVQSLIFIVLLIPLYVLLYKLFIPRISAFGCFDDCFNIVGGYFMLKGKMLYSEVFFNHQMGMAYISYLIQFVTTPENMYELILNHRKFLLVFSLIMNVLIVLRFKSRGFLTIILYEMTKFYLFGNRFLAEAFIVYPLIYVFGLSLEKIQKKKLYAFDYIIASFFTWFIVFLREPYIPVTFFLFFVVVFDKHMRKVQYVSIFTFFLLSGFTIFIQPLSDYFFNLFTVNNQTILDHEFKNRTNLLFWLFEMFSYPFLSIWGNHWNIFRYIFINLSFFFTFFLMLLIAFRKYFYPLFILITLGIANIRSVEIGRIYYEAFHMIPWFGLFTFSVFSLLYYLYEISPKKKTAIILGISLFSIYLSILVSPQSYVYEKPYPHEEFITHYGRELQIGEAIKKLSSSNDTLFLDGFDDLIYWQALLISPYKYSWYTSVMPKIKRYSDARIEMFLKNPPTFYYGSCPNEKTDYRLLPDRFKKDYIRLYEYGRPSCLFIKKEKIKFITQKQWNDAKKFGYSLSKEN